MKKNNFLTIFFSIFAVSGLLLLIGGLIWLLSGASFLHNAEKVSATITDIETYKDYDHRRHHDVYVDYICNGISYQDVLLNSYSSSMYVGKTITIYCDLNNPERIMLPLSLSLGGSILILLGVIFGTTGIIPLIIFSRKKKRRSQLLSQGQVLYATVESVSVNTLVSVNGRCPYVIYCTWRDEYKDVIYRFKSEYLWVDPSPVFPVGTTIEVYVDRNDYSRYYVNANQTISEKIIDFT